MAAKKKSNIRVYVVYTDKDEAFYQNLKPHLERLKAEKRIKSFASRRLEGNAGEQEPDPELAKSNIILVGVSGEFVVGDYIDGSEMQKALAMHLERKASLVPVIFKETDLNDTPLKKLRTLPSKKRAILDQSWSDLKEAYEDVAEGILRVIREIEESTPDNPLIPARERLPFCIKRFQIRDFQCIKDSELADIPINCQWIFITGENGDGKTSLLQALALGLLGNDRREGTELLGEESAIQVEFRAFGENTVGALSHDGKTWQHESSDISRLPLQGVLGYGVTRMKLMGQKADDDIGIKYPTLSLYNESEGDFKNIETRMTSRKWEHSARLHEVKDILRRLMPAVESVEISGDDVFYIEKGFKARSKQVSSGNKSIIAMIGDMLVRLLHMQPEVKEIGDLQGIVLIDELDLHLHPRWQKELPSLLSDIFPQVQFWATTHSIVPFMGAPERSIFLRASRDEKTGTQIDKLDIDVKNLLPNTLISSPLFGVEDFIHKDADNFRTETLYSDVKRRRYWEEKLAEAAKDFKLPPESIFFDKGGKE